MRLLIGAAVAVLSLSGCAEDAVPDVPQARDCDAARPSTSGPRADDGSGAELVPADPRPVSMTVCTYDPMRPDEAPTERAFSGDEVRATVDELNGFPPLRHPDEHVCNAAAWPGTVMLVEHADGTVTALTVDRSCGLVTDGDGAVRMGVPAVLP
ncbi:UNVERIFIED_ORG: hypothetical protein E4P37_16930 [Bacillus sp. AZ43]